MLAGLCIDVAAEPAPGCGPRPWYQVTSRSARRRAVERYGHEFRYSIGLRGAGPRLGHERQRAGLASGQPRAAAAVWRAGVVKPQQRCRRRGVAWSRRAVTGLSAGWCAGPVYGPGVSRAPRGLRHRRETLLTLASAGPPASPGPAVCRARRPAAAPASAPTRPSAAAQGLDSDGLRADAGCGCGGTDAGCGGMERRRLTRDQGHEPRRADKTRSARVGPRSGTGLTARRGRGGRRGRAGQRGDGSGLMAGRGSGESGLGWQDREERLSRHRGRLSRLSRRALPSCACAKPDVPITARPPQAGEARAGPDMPGCTGAWEGWEGDVARLVAAFGAAQVRTHTRPKASAPPPHTHIYTKHT